MNQYVPDPSEPARAGGRRCGWLKAAATAAVAATAVAAAANAVIALRSAPAHSLPGGVFGRYPFRHGALAWTVAGSGPPLLLLHGFGAGNSMSEWSASFELLRKSHTVYAFDFPSWGLSDKPGRIVKAEEYIEAILFFAEDIIGAPCTVIASSDACSFAIEAAARRPDLIDGLVLICPAMRAGDAAAQERASVIQRLFLLPVFGRAIANALTTRGAIRSFAERHLYFDKSRVTEAVVTRYHSAAHLPGSERALGAFVSGALSHDARAAWSELPQPALLVWGRNAQINPLTEAPEWLALRSDAGLEVIDDAMLLPHVERPAEFHALVTDWMGRRGE